MEIKIEADPGLWLSAHSPLLSAGRGITEAPNPNLAGADPLKQARVPTDLGETLGVSNQAQAASPADGVSSPPCKSGGKQLRVVTCLKTHGGSRQAAS